MLIMQLMTPEKAAMRRDGPLLHWLSPALIACCFAHPCFSLASLQSLSEIELDVTGTEALNQ